MKLDDALQAMAANPKTAGTGALASEPDAQAWRREMERAQSENWFHAFVAPAGRNAKTPERGATDSQASTPSGPRAPWHRPAGEAAKDDAVSHRTLTRPLPTETAASRQAGFAIPAAYRSASPDPTVQPPLPAVTLSIRWPRPATAAAAATADVTLPLDTESRWIAIAVGSPEAAGDITETADAEETPRARPAREESMRLPVRVHVEGDSEQSTVWLGLDAQAAVNLPAVTRAITQWLARAGYGEPRWICNGQPLDPGAPLPADEDIQASTATPFPVIDRPQGETA